MRYFKMGYQTKVQVINRKYSKQYYIVLPVPLAQALEIEKGEKVEWIIKDKEELLLKRIQNQGENNE